MFSRLPNIGVETRELIDATAAFAFEGEPTDLLHPSVERQQLFPSEIIMPKAELLTTERDVSVVAGISRSLMGIIMDGCGSYHQGYPSAVSNPGAYLELLKTGKKVSKVKSAYGPIAERDDSKYEPNYHVITGVVYETFVRIIGQDMMKPAMGMVERAEPMLQPGETKESRNYDRRFTKEVKAQRWRYARTLGLAAFSGLMIYNAHQTSQIAQVENPPKIAALELESEQATPERAEEIRREEILPLKMQMDGGAGVWLVVGAIASARFGLHYMTRPRRREDDQE